MRDDNKISNPELPWLLCATLAFLVVILLVELLLSWPGDRVTLYALIAAVTLLPALLASRQKRIWAVVVTIIVLGRLIWDDQQRKGIRRSEVGPVISTKLTIT